MVIGGFLKEMSGLSLKSKKAKQWLREMSSRQRGLPGQRHRVLEQPSTCGGGGVGKQRPVEISGGQMEVDSDGRRALVVGETLHEGVNC